MRVCVLTAFPLETGSPRGGVEAVSVTLVRALQAHPELDLHVVTATRGIASPQRGSWEQATIHRLPWVGRWTLTGALGPGGRCVREYVRRLQPDVVHAHDTYGLMARGLDLPRVLTIHGFIHGDTLVSRRQWARLRARVWRHVETRAWADYPHIISISPYVRERLTGIACGVVHDIDNPIDEGFFGLPRRDRERDVLCAAVISRRKNTLTLIEALARLRARGIAVRLRLAGAVTEPEYGRLVNERIATLGLQDSVAQLGELSREQLRGELQRARVFALVSREENSPLGIEEAMAAGVPVVASNRCGMPYLVRDGRSGFLVDPESPDDVAFRVGQVLEDAALRAGMTARARDIARDRFHPAHVAERTLEVYRRAARRALDPAGAMAV